MAEPPVGTGSNSNNGTGGGGRVLLVKRLNMKDGGTTVSDGKSGTPFYTNGHLYKLRLTFIYFTRYII